MQRLLLIVAALAAATVPALLAYNLPPSSTLLNQCVAVGLWGWFVLALMPANGLHGGLALQAGLAALAVGIAGSGLFGSLPPSLTLSALGLVLAAAVLAWAGGDAARREDARHCFAWFASGLALAGLLSAVVAGIQVFAPEWPDGDFIARSGLPGRAVGNLRQPNHLSSLLLWALIAVVALVELGWWRRAWGVAAAVVLTLAVVLSGSRTGALGTALLAGWGLADRKLGRASRVTLMLTPLIYAAGVLALNALLAEGGSAIGVAGHIGGYGTGDPSSSRFGIWSNTLALIARHPLAGVGFGEFNLAWSLTAFPGRPTAFFDHTHNLPLQLMVELGLPLSLGVLAALAVAVVQAWRRAGRRDDAAGPAARAALIMVLMIGLHSLLEYPLWYSYFLLPAAFAFGFALGTPQAGRAARPAGTGTWGAMAGALLAAGGAAAVADYLSVVVIFAPPENAGPLDERIERGQRSPLFAHHADYAAATHGDDMARRGRALLRAPHYLLDTRLMIAWAEWLAANGRVDQARWLADRLREFRNPASDDFLAPCDATPPADAFQCQRPQAPHDWREFLR